MDVGYTRPGWLALLGGLDSAVGWHLANNDDSLIIRLHKPLGLNISYIIIIIYILKISKMKIL